MEVLHQVHTYANDPPLLALRVDNLEYKPHWHAETEILYVVSGSISAIVNGQSLLCRAGDFLAMGSRDVHSFENLPGGSETIVIIFRPELIGYRSAWPLSGRLASCHFQGYGKPTLSGLVKTACLALVSEASCSGPGHDSLCRGYLSQLCGLAERFLADEASPRPGFPAKRSTQERVQAAIDFIHDKALYPISLEDAAKAAYMSPCYFSRVFKAVAGCGFKAFVNEVRVSRAELIMATSQKTLAEIALECGFENLRSFNRAFRSARNQCPSQARLSVTAK